MVESSQIVIPNLPLHLIKDTPKFTQKTYLIVNEKA